MKPFSLISGLLLLLVAAAHAYRIYAGIPLDVNGESFPTWMSWVAIVVPGILGVMTIVESRR